MRATAAIRAIAFSALLLSSSVLVLTAPARADAWTKLDMGIPYSGTVSRGLCKVAVGDGDNDNSTEVYFSGWDDGHVYRFNYSDGNWNYWDLGKLVSANDVRARGMLVGDGDDDGLNEVYVSGVYRDWWWQPWTNRLWRFSWNGETWDKTDMGASGATSRDIALGDGNNDGRQELYSADATGHVYEYSKGNEWNVQDIGSVPKFYDEGTGTWVTPAVRGVSVGDADNDGFNEVYAATSDHHVYRFSYDNASATWDLGDVGTGVDDGTSDNYYQGFTKVVVGDADNDGLMEAYASSYINATVYRFKWNSTTAAWERTSLVSLGVKENAHDLCIGDGNSDGLNEIYAGTSNKQVYEVFFNDTSGQWESLAVGSGNAAMNGVAFFPGSWPPSPGFDPWAILISSCSARAR